MKCKYCKNLRKSYCKNREFFVKQKGRNARFCENLEIGTEVKVVGRVQSRNYEKKYEDGTVEQKVAYEVSVGSLEFANKNDDEKQEENKEAM